MSIGPKVGRNEPCPCGSGKKWKHCHGGLASPRLNQKAQEESTLNATVPLAGVPGEVQNLITINARRGERPPTAMPWRPGDYRVQLMLGRPGFPENSEYTQSFIGKRVGNSHLRILKPASERRTDEPDQMLWWSVYMNKAGERVDIQFTGEANSGGFLAKFSTTVPAKNANEAAAIAYASLGPLLSALSSSGDIPLSVESIEVIEVATGNGMVRVVAPFPEQAFTVGGLPFLSEDYCHYAGLYREAMQTNSSFYRFLCLFKIIEGLHKRRGRLTAEAKLRGDYASRRPLILERVPATKEDQLRLLRSVYPLRTDSGWDDLFLGQTFPKEVHGRSLRQVRDQILEKVRDSIAHALLVDGEPGISVDDLEDHWTVNKWLPLTRFFARMMLTNDFPTEFQLSPNV